MPKPEKKTPWKWIVICVLCLVIAAAGWKMHASASGKETLSAEVSSTANAYIKDRLFSYNRGMRDVKTKLLWTNCSTRHFEVWVVLDRMIPAVSAVELAIKLNDTIRSTLTFTLDIPEQQLRDDRCLVSVYIVCEEAGMKYLYGGSLCTYTYEHLIPSWFNSSEVMSMLHNDLPFENCKPLIP